MQADTSLQAHDRQLQGVLGLPSTTILLLPNFHLGKTLFIPVDTIVSHACTPFPLKPTSVRHVPPPHHQNHRTVRTPQTPRLWARPSTCSPAVPSHPSTSPTGPCPPASLGSPLPADPHRARHVPQVPGPRLLATTTQDLSPCGLQVHQDASRAPAPRRAQPSSAGSVGTSPSTRAPPALNSWSSPASLLGPGRSPVTATPPSSTWAPAAGLSLFSPATRSSPVSSVLSYTRLLTPDRCRHPEPSLYQATLIIALTSQLNTWFPLLPPSQAHSQHSSKNNPCQTHSDDVPPALRLL